MRKRKLAGIESCHHQSPPNRGTERKNVTMKKLTLNKTMIEFLWKMYEAAMISGGLFSQLLGVDVYKFRRLCVKRWPNHIMPTPGNQIKIRRLKVGERIENNDWCWDERVGEMVRVTHELSLDENGKTAPPVTISEAHHPHFRIEWIKNWR